MEVALLSMLFVIYNNVLNRWPPFNGWLYLPLNLGATVALVWAALVPLGLSPSGVGITGNDRADWLLGAAAGALLASPLLAAAWSDRWASLVADRRVGDLSGASFGFQVLVRVPIGTALFEEIAFRGVLLSAATQELTQLQGVLVSSAVFGLWHIAPTLNLMRANRPAAAAPAVATTVTAAVALTGTAGALLCLVRLWTGGLAAPVMLHAAVNSLATVAAVAAVRRRGSSGGPVDVDDTVDAS